MVLGRLPSNFVPSKRNAENTPPKLSTLRSSASSIAATSRRRRARCNGTSNINRAIDAARRRNTHSSRSALRELTPPSTPPTSDDEEMPQTPDSQTPYAVSQPFQRLPQPVFPVISMAAPTAAHYGLEDVPLPFLREKLKAFGPEMLDVLANISVLVVKNKLPKEMGIVVNNVSSYMPTHLLAVYAHPQASGQVCNVTLFPVHDIVLTAYCGNLPMFSVSKPAVPETAGASIVLPVVPLGLSFPESFPPLIIYLYTKCADRLLAALLPNLPTPTGSVDASLAALLQLQQRLASMYDVQVLAKMAKNVKQLWYTVCELGIEDGKLWAMMQIAWSVLLNAIQRKTGRLLNRSA